jgi:hypothetical protein
MNGTRLLLPILALVLAAGACAAPTRSLLPLDPALDSAVREGCRKPFLNRPLRLVHALEFEVSGGKSAAIGVIAADPGNRTFRTALMTLEGWVLFDVESGKTLTVHRAVPPFDSPAFARRMAEDIGLVFFFPAEPLLALGKEERGAPVCRFGRAGGGFADLIESGENQRELRLYDAGGDERKRATFSSFNAEGLAGVVEIRSESPSYRLRLRLLESEPMAAQQ